MEWKRGRSSTASTDIGDLGNFLSGMETGAVCFSVDPGATLGNFLSGMETGRSQIFTTSPDGLGNFLSGMETPQRLAGRRLRAGPLETSLVEWKLIAVVLAAGAISCLGNFLSGMETILARRPRGCRWALGNFLSGMETKYQPRHARSDFALETSLVEWKLDTFPPRP